MDAEMLTTVTRLREAATRLRSVGFVQLAEQVEALAENEARSQLASKAPRATRMNVMMPRALVASVLGLLLIASSVVLFSETGTAPTAPLLCVAGAPAAMTCPAPAPLAEAARPASQPLE
jgi:hypothetical protein